ncbi:MAG: SPFH domain-containing protein [Myxococcota bacterium]|nr:SPFH domain-containing protein [Myxococcota bacterium]
MHPFLSFLLGIAIATVILMFLVRKRIRVSSHQALLIFRRGIPARVSFNDVVILPFWEEVEFIELKRFILKWRFVEKDSLYTKDYQRMDLALELELSIPRDTKKILSLAQDFSADTLHDAEKIQALLTPQLQQTLGSILVEKSVFDWNYERTELIDELKRRLSFSRKEWEVQNITISLLRSTAKSAYKEDSLEDQKGLLAFSAEEESLEQIKIERLEIAEQKQQRDLEKASLQEQSLENQHLKIKVDEAKASLQRDIDIFQQNISVQIDILKAHLDTELSVYRKEASQSAALLGKTLPQGMTKEVDKIRNQQRIEADMLKREHLDRSQDLHTDKK